MENNTNNIDGNKYYTRNEVLELIEKAKIDEDVDVVFLLVCAIFIFLMQMGFAMLEAGTVRSKNSSNILLKNLLDTYVGAIVYYLIGYGLANNAMGGIIGQYHFASTNFEEKDYLNWILQYSVCSNIPTIVAGSLAERTFVDTYMFFSLLMTGFIYPVAAAWTWGGGWLKVLGFRDFAGAGVVHLLGGVCGMVGTIILGPRLGIFEDTENKIAFPIIDQNQERTQKIEKDQDYQEVIRFKDYSEFIEKKSSHQQTRRRSNSQRNLVSKWVSLLQEQEQIQRKQFQNNQTRVKRRSLSKGEKIRDTSPNQSSEQKSSSKGPLSVEQKRNLFRQLKFNSEGDKNLLHDSIPEDKQKNSQNSFVNQKVNNLTIQKNDMNRYRVKKLSNPHNLIRYQDPYKKARMQKIRKEFPEFEMVDDKQLDQIIRLYDINIKSPIRPSSVALIVQGTFFLWICWLFYNISPSNGITQNKTKNQPSLILMNTILSSAGSCVGIIFIMPWIISRHEDPTNKYPVQQICNSLLVGLVAITGCCNNVRPWVAVVVGLIGTLIYSLACKLFEKLKIDDPLESSQIHAFCGLWGLLAIGFFDNDNGIFFAGNLNFMLIQLIGAFSIIIWAALVSFLYFYMLKRMNKFRVGHIYEITGMDVLMHGGTDLLSNEMINKIEARQRSIANANKLMQQQLQAQIEQRRREESV